MNRRQKIIVSVTGIFLVLLIIVGLTYAYFLTQINGNTEEKSISITTANLELVYGDGNGILEAAELIEPGKDIKFKDVNGNIVDSKIFTVTNKGNSTIDEYAIVLDNFSVTYASNGTTKDDSGNTVTYTEGEVTSFVFPNDIIMNISCKSYENYGQANQIESGTCNGVEKALPTTNDILKTNSIEVGKTHEYQLTLQYLETGIDQSRDMNKTITGRINLIDTKNTLDISGTIANYTTGDYIETNSTKRISYINPDGSYKIVGLENGTHLLKVCGKEDTDCSNPKMSETIIINPGNEENVSGNTITKTADSRGVKISIDAQAQSITIDESFEKYNPYSKGTLAYAILNNAINPGVETSTIYSPTPLTTPSAEISGADERTLSTVNDDYGVSYYYRGNVVDNYVNFANMCWRIVRVMGDGTVKLILEDQNALCQNSVTSSASWNIPSRADGTGTNGTFGFQQNTELQSGKTVNVISFRHGIDGYTTGNYNSLGTALKLFQSTKLSGYSDDLATGNWCLDESGYETKTGILLSEDEKMEYFKGKINPQPAAKNTSKFWYGPYVRIDFDGIQKPSLKCYGKIMNDWDDTSKTPLYAGTITIDEAVFAGGASEIVNENYYLINGFESIDSPIYNKNHYFYTLSPNVFYNGVQNNVYKVESSGYVGTTGVSDNYGSFRPAIVLKNNVVINTTTNGTKTNPYVIN